jgi:hypothetical protein
VSTPHNLPSLSPSLAAGLTSAIFFAIAGAACGMVTLGGLLVLVSSIGYDLDWKYWLFLSWFPFAFVLGIINAKMAWQFRYKPSSREAGWYLLISCLVLATCPFIWLA